MGSVGTRCWVALFVGRDNGDPLFLQVKEAEAAVGEPFLGAERVRPPRASGWSRASDSCRGPATSSSAGTGFQGDDGVTRDFYVRQLWDWKVSADVETMAPEALGIYAQMCGWTLARAHARSGDAIAIGSYLGAGDRFDRGHVRASPPPTPTRTSGTSSPSSSPITTDKVARHQRRLSGPAASAIRTARAPRPAITTDQRSRPAPRELTAPCPCTSTNPSVTSSSIRSTPARTS